MLDMAQFLVEQGSDVTARNKWGQIPANVALSNNRLLLHSRFCERFSLVPLCIVWLYWCWYPEALQTLQFPKPTRTIILSWLPRCFLQFRAFIACLSMRWFMCFGFFISFLLVEFEGQVAEAKGKIWSACSVLCLQIKRKWDGRNRNTKLAAEAVARQQEDRGTQRKEKQQGKNGRKKGNRSASPEAKTNKHSTPRDAKPQETETERDESVAATDGKRNTNKKNKNKKPGRARGQQQDLGEAEAMPGDVSKEEETATTTLQEPVREQQALSSLTPPAEKAEDLAEQHMQVLTAVANAEGEDSTSTPFSPDTH